MDLDLKGKVQGIEVWPSFYRIWLKIAAFNWLINLGANVISSSTYDQFYDLCGVITDLYDIPGLRVLLNAQK